MLNGSMAREISTWLRQNQYIDVVRTFERNKILYKVLAVFTRTATSFYAVISHKWLLNIENDHNILYMIVTFCTWWQHFVCDHNILYLIATFYLWLPHFVNDYNISYMIATF